MKTYSDLPATDSVVIGIHLRPVGLPNIRIGVNHDLIDYVELSKPVQLDYQVGLLDNINITVELHNKEYCIENETAVIIDGITVDHVNIIPKYNYLAEYVNDHAFKDPTSYLGFNGKWTLTIDRPFYQWLHQVTGQGWLLS
jgi:hypothetical protein